jgi:hypothetical protein
MLDEKRFDSGYDFAEYLKVINARKDDWFKNYQEFRLTEAENKKLASISKRFNILALSEDWCGDSVRNLPVIVRMVEALPHAKLRVLTRDDNLDVMQKFTADGKMRIPTVVFSDENFKILALWIEEPKNAPQLKQRLLSEPDGKDKYLAALKEEVKQEIFSLLDEIKDR